jgi:hypothetical protein
MTVHFHFLHGRENLDDDDAGERTDIDRDNHEEPG